MGVRGVPSEGGDDPGIKRGTRGRGQQRGGQREALSFFFAFPVDGSTCGISIQDIHGTKGGDKIKIRQERRRRKGPKPGTYRRHAARRTGKEGHPPFP